MGRTYYLGVMPKDDIEEITQLYNPIQAQQWLHRKHYPYDEMMAKEEGCVSYSELLYKNTEVCEVTGSGSAESILEEKALPVFGGKLASWFQYYNVRYTNDVGVIRLIEEDWKENLKQYYRILIDRKETEWYVDKKLQYVDWHYKIPTADRRYMVANCDDYEYNLFNLIYLRKNFNPEKEVIIGYGH